MIFDLSKTNSIANTFIAEMRDENIQLDSMRFRKNLERLGEFFAFEISKTLSYHAIDTQTPLGIAKSNVLIQQPVLATILRAGLPMQQGLLNVFDKADCAFITAYRKTKKNGDFIIQMEHISAPDLEDKTVILVDPMLATGASIVLCAKELINRHKIKKLHIVAAIASSEGVKHVRANLPKADLWLGAIDEEMTTKSYIVPGLGDAGDLAYGGKGLTSWQFSVDNSRFTIMNILFVCSRNKWRSATAEAIYQNHPYHQIRSAGTANSARIKINSKMIIWADLIFVMEKRHKQILNENFSGELQDKEMIVLDIPDDYQYMDEELILEITSKVDNYL